MSYRINGKDYSPVIEEGYLPKKENAELIVRAVNRDHLFEQMLTACKLAWNALTPNPMDKREAVKALKEAIKAAELAAKA